MSQKYRPTGFRIAKEHRNILDQERMRTGKTRSEIVRELIAGIGRKQSQGNGVRNPHKVDLSLAQAVYSLAKQEYIDVSRTCITIGDCLNSPTIAEKYILTNRIIEDVFDYLQDIDCGTKCIEDDNSSTVTFTLNKNELSRSS